MKLFKSLSLLAALCASLSYGMDQSFEGADNIVGIRWKKDNFGNVILNSQDIDLNQGSVLTYCARSLLDREPGNALIIYLSHQEGHKLQPLIEAGFTPRHIDSTKTELIIKNGSPMPDASTAAAGARVLVCRGNEVLMIEDKNMKGRAVYPGGSVDAEELALDAACREMKEEVGLTIQPTDMQKIALVNRIRGNRYSYSDYCHYYMARKFTGEVKIQASEVLQAFWAPINDVANSETINGLKTSPTVKLLAAHIVKNGHTSSERVLDPRQYARPADQQDARDVMDIDLFHIKDHETNSNL